MRCSSSSDWFCLRRAGMAIRIKCSACGYGAQVPDNYAGREILCPQCGGKITVGVIDEPQASKLIEPVRPEPESARPREPTATQPASRACPHCSRNISVQAKVCIWCGFPVEAQPHTGGIAAVPAEAVGLEETRPCPYCAEQIKAAAKKCMHCGEFLDAKLAATRRKEEKREQVREIAWREQEKRARDAFICALIGILFSLCICPGVVLGILGIIQGTQANRQLVLMGKPATGLGTAAMVIGIIDCILGAVFAMIYFLSGLFQRGL